MSETQTPVVKVLEKVMSELPPAPRKEFYKTSEFWLTVMSSAAAILTTYSGYMSPNMAALMLTLANGLYAISRGLAKKA